MAKSKIPPKSKALDEKEKKEVNAIVKAAIKEEKEVKYIHTLKDSVNATQLTPVAYTPQLILLNGCTQGDTVSNRQGNKFKPFKIDLDFDVYGNVATITDVVVRYGILYDRQPNGAVPVFALTQTTSLFDDLGTGVAFLNMQRLVATQNRYKLLLDKTIVLKVNAMATATASVSATQNYKHRLKFNMPMTRCASGQNAGTIADIVEGSYYFFIVSDGTTNAEFMSRLWFTDSE